MSRIPRRIHLLCGSVLLCLVLSILFQCSQAAQSFADTCACPDPAPCPSFCIDCNSYDSDCVSGKTQGYCNGEGHDVCPAGYIQKTQEEVSRGVWYCSYGGGRYRMYHCYRECLGITTGQCNMCMDGYYAFNNNQTCNLCEAGSYCTAGQIQGLCDTGHYCEAGSTMADQNQCPPGTFGEVQGLTSSVCSGNCDPGYYCEAGSTDPKQHPCMAGNWGSSGESTASCSGQCSAGYYCPEGSSSSKAFECGGASRYCPEGASNYTAVQTGFYSTPVNANPATRTAEQVCPKGHFCQGGIMEPCAAGRYSPGLGATSCDLKCSAGFYCPPGSKSPNANPCYPDPLNPPDHPAEYYCEEGTSAPTQVLDGYYSTPESAPETQRTGQEYADPVLYTTRDGRRFRKVEWRADCANDEGSIVVQEYTNDLNGEGSPGFQLIGLEAFDNVDNVAVTQFSLSDLRSVDHPVSSGESCSDYVGSGRSLFTIENANELRIRNGYSLDFELCEKFVVDINAHSVSNSSEVSTCSLTVHVQNINDKPFFPDENGFKGPLYPNDHPPLSQYSVAERTPKNEGVGTPIQVEDEDEGQEVFFEILPTLDGPLDTFYIGSCSGQLYVQQDSLDFQSKSLYQLQIRACDDPQFFGGDASCTVTTNVTIAVLDINDPPSFSLSPEIKFFAVEENAPRYTPLVPWCAANATTTVPCTELDPAFTYLVVDDLDLAPDRSSTTDIMTFTITRNDRDAFSVNSCVRANNLDLCPVNDPENLALELPSGTLLLAEQLDYETSNMYSITVRVNDGRGLEQAQEFEIRVINVNDAPNWATAPTEVFFSENTVGETQRIFASDEDNGAILTYQVLEVLTSDSTPMDPTMFEVVAPATAGEGEEVELELTQAADFESDKYFSVIVQATDEHGASTNTTLRASIKDVNEYLEILTDIVYVPENLPFGTVLGEKIQAFDPDNLDSQVGDEDYQKAYFSLEPSSTNLFTVQTQGNITTQDPLNYELFQNYTMTVIARDNGVPTLEVSKLITVVVLDQAEPPTIVSGQKFTFTELSEPFNPETMTLPTWNASVQAYDDDDGDILTLSILRQYVKGTAIDVNFFQVNGTTITLKSTDPTIPNYESVIFQDSEEIIVELRGVDQDGLDSTETISIEILNANDRPILSNGTFAVSKHVLVSPCTVDTYCLPGSVVGNVFEFCSDEDVRGDLLNTKVDYAILAGNDGDTFEIEQGVLKVKNISDEIRTANHTFTLTIQATDQDVNQPLSSEPVDFVVNVVGVNNKPIVVDSVLSLTENDEQEVDTGSFEVLIQDFGAVDPDETVMVYKKVFVSPQDMDGVFEVTTDGTLVRLRPLDYEASNNGEAIVEVEVRDNNGEGNWLSNTFRITIRITDINEAPVLLSSAFSVDENTPAGPIPGAIVSATDPDIADVGNLRYQFNTIATSPFTLDESTGQVSQDGTLDYELVHPGGACSLVNGLHQCRIPIVVHDAAGRYDQSELVIAIQNVNEPPSLQFPTCELGIACEPAPPGGSPSMSVAEDLVKEGERKIAKFTTDEPDRIPGKLSGFSSVSYVLMDGEVTPSGATELDHFRLDPTGVLYLVSALDFENKTWHDLRVGVYDLAPVPLHDEYMLRINVSDVDDIGMVHVEVNGPWDTAGGENLTITGDNFGPTEYKIAQESPNPAFLPVEVYLGTPADLLAGGPLMQASGCEINSHTEIFCETTPGGVGTGYYWEVRIGTAKSVPAINIAGQIASFRRPTVSQVDGVTALETAGGAVFNIHGDNFGPPGTQVSAKYRLRNNHDVEFHTLDCAVTDHSVRTTCTSVAGVGTNLQFAIIVAGYQSEWYSDPSVVFQHRAPSVLQVYLKSGSTKLETAGSSTDRIVIAGENFGSAADLLRESVSVVVEYGQSDDPARYLGENCQVTVDHEQIECTYGPGVGLEMKFVVTVAKLRSNPSPNTLSYLGPQIFDISGPGAENAATKGGDAVLLTGVAFGPLTGTASKDLHVYYGGPDASRYEATGCAVVSEQTVIECKTAPGTGRDHAWRVVVSGQESQVAVRANGEGTWYSPPTINKFRSVSATQGSTVGGEEIVLEGVDFGDGSSNSPVSASFGRAGVTFEARNCSVVPEFKHTRVKCILPPGIGRSLSWAITVDGQSSQVPTSAYKPPVVSNITDTEGHVLGLVPTRGGVLAAIHGSDFGTDGVHSTGDFLSVSYGPITGSEYNTGNCTVVKDQPSEIWCMLAPGVGKNLKLVVTSWNQKSTLSSKVTLSYAPPVVYSVSPPVGATGPGMTLTVNGTDFGPTGSAQVRWNDGLLSLGMQSHVQLIVSIPEDLQRGTNNNVQVTTGDQTATFMYSFTEPIVHSISAVSPPRNYTGQGPQQILIRGENFGTFLQGDSIVSVGGVACDVSEWSHTYIACNTTEVAGPMFISVGGQSCKMKTDTDNSAGCCPCDFDYAELLRPPILNSISICDEQDFGGCHTNGGYFLTVHGEDLGTYQYGRVEVNGKPCEVIGGNLNYTSTKISCLVPPGEGNGPVQVYQAWKVTQEEITFFYDPPVLESVSPLTAPTTGNIVVTLQGRNFGVTGPMVSLREAALGAFPGSTIERPLSIESFSHERINLRLPPGEGDVFLNVRVAGQDALPWDRHQVSYVQANISSVSPEHGSTRGEYEMTLFGNNFGTNGTVHIGNRTCEITEYGHTVVKCQVPAGGGERLDVILTAGGRGSAPPHPQFTYDRPEIDSIHPNHGPTAGGSKLTVIGRNFGTGIQIQIGAKHCTETNALSDEVVECLSPANIGRDHRVLANLDGQLSRQNVSFHYDPPMVDSYSPSPMNAFGGELVLYGRNFGSNETDPGAPTLAMSLANVPCDAVQRVSDSEIRCTIPPHPVGSLPLALTTAGQSMAESQDVFVVCYSGFFGQPGEMCGECPPGGYCMGYRSGTHYDPRALPEWGSVGRAEFRRCIPREACLGDDLCQLGYEHSSETELLCQSCFRGNSTLEVGYYRLEGQCVECPRLAWLLLVGVLFGAAVLCGTAYLLTKHGVQLAAVSIGIDFAQVCSLFATYGFEWPPLVLKAYAALSAFNLNLELASPECSVGWDYKTKWQVMFFMPPMFAGVFSVSLVYSFIKAKVKSLMIAWENHRHQVLPKKALAKLNARRARRNSNGTVVKQIVEEPPKRVLYEKKLLVDDGDIEDYDASFNRFVDAEFGAFLIMCYYLYLSVMKKIFEVFNCRDGTLVVETSIKCTMEDHVYARLYTFSSIGILVYGIGIPGGISYLLYRHKVLIQRDQHRREANMSESQAATALQNAWRGYHVRKLVNPTAILRRHKLLTNIGRARAKYGKLYEDFTGDCFYWRVLLLVRKLLLVIITMFGQEKYQQTCLAFGVLFISYALQVKHRPYLARYKTRSKTTGRMTRLKSRAPRGFSKLNQFIPRNNGDEGQAAPSRLVGMDQRQYEINRSVAKRILSQKIPDSKEGDKPKRGSEKRWEMVKHFVSTNDASKYHLPTESALELGQDMFRWLFDYNSLEALSLGTSMYVLLFGMLFDSYNTTNDDVKIDLLAAFTLSLFTTVLLVFAASVWLDVYRKFWAKFRSQLPWVRNKTVPLNGTQVAPTKEASLIPAHRGQWIAPVNPFATLASQNANLVKAEERRIAAIMERKMRHMQELEERQRLQQAERDKREAEYRSRMKKLEEEMLENEERVMEEERALELELEEQARMKQEQIDRELREKLERVAHGVTNVDSSAILEVEKAMENATEMEFEMEKEVVLAEQRAKEVAEQAKMKEKQMNELSSAIADLESEAESLFVGRREHQEELKARLWERRMRKPRRKKKRKDGEEPTKEELLIEQLEDKFEEIVARQELEMNSLTSEQESTRNKVLSDLKNQVQERVSEQVKSDEDFEKEAAKELLEIEEKMKEEARELEAKVAEAESEELKTQFKMELSKLSSSTQKKREQVRASILAKRQQRAVEMEAKEVSRAEERSKAMEEANNEAKRIAEELTKKELEIAEKAGANKTQVNEVKELFAVHQEKLDKETQRAKDSRRAALEKRVKARRAVIAATAKRQESNRDLVTSVSAASIGKPVSGAPGRPTAHLAANTNYGEDHVEEVLTPEQVQERLEKIKEEAQIRKDNLDKMLRANKSAQREKLRERLNRRKEKAEQMKRDLENEKKKAEEEAERKLREEEEKIRERHNKEIQEIEEARIEVLLDENHAKSLADGVKQWRQRRDDKKKQGDPESVSNGPTAGTISTRRSSILRQDFAGKARHLEEMVAEARAKQMEEARKRAKNPNAEPSEVELNIQKLQEEVKQHVKDLNTLYQNYDEEVEAEINKLANEAAVEKARQRRKIDMLNAFAEPEAVRAAAHRETTFIPPNALTSLVISTGNSIRRGSRSNPASPRSPVSPLRRPSRTPGGQLGVPPSPIMPPPIGQIGPAGSVVRLPGQPIPPNGQVAPPSGIPGGGMSPPPMMRVNLKQLSLRRLGDV